MCQYKEKLLDDFFINVKDVSNKTEITEKILKGNQVIKFGIDPTGSELHLGHLFIIKKLQILQTFGNKIVIILGDFTASVGDPSGRDTTRPSLSKDTIITNTNLLLGVLYKYLDPNITTYHYNSTWLSQLTLQEILELANKVNVNQMLKRPDFKQRHESNTSIQLSEFLYPLLQGYDSVVINSDLELGGSDQLFNVQMGNRLGNHQEYITFNILEGIDNTSRKMSKTFDNHISLDLSPHQIYQKIINMPDYKISCFNWLVNGEDMLLEHNALNTKKMIAFKVIEFIHNPATALEFKSSLEKSKALSFDFASEYTTIYNEASAVTLFTVIKFLKDTTNLKISDMIKNSQVKINEQIINFDFTFKNLDIVYNIQLGKKVFIKLKFQKR